MKRTIVIFCILIISTLSNAQSYCMGLLCSDEKAAELPQKAAYLSRGFEGLPAAHSLQKYCPTPMQQGNYGTCVGWSSAYAARTIAEAVAYSWTDKETINREAFSPWFVYNNIKHNDDYDCKEGTFLEDAVRFLSSKGVAKRCDYFTPCEVNIPQIIFTKAYQYRIDEYSSLFYNLLHSQHKEKIQKVKMSLANNRPVIIAARCYKSLSDAKEKWNGVQDVFRGNHAMCVVAYDDTKFGEGAFLIQNSWGTDWGVGGFSWITYKDFADVVYQAIEIYVKPKSFITKSNLLSGSLRLQLSTGEEMRGTLSGGIYKISGEYISGTRYRIYISNNQPAYVYVIGSDLQNNVSKVFPPNDRISPALTYKSNNIAIPDENWYVQMDNTVGKDYVCVLYSAEELDIQTIVSKIRSGYGSFYDKVSLALSGKLATGSDVNFSQNTISFSAQTNKTVVAVIAEVVHR